MAFSPSFRFAILAAIMERWLAVRCRYTHCHLTLLNGIDQVLVTALEDSLGGFDGCHTHAKLCSGHSV